MDRTVRIAIIVACVTITLAAIVLTTVVVTRSLQGRPPEGSAKTEDTTVPDPKTASGSSKVQEACEAARLKLLQGEVTSALDRGALRGDVALYCEDKTESQ